MAISQAGLKQAIVQAVRNYYRSDGSGDLPKECPLCHKQYKITVQNCPVDGTKLEMREEPRPANPIYSGAMKTYVEMSLQLMYAYSGSDGSATVEGKISLPLMATTPNVLSYITGRTSPGPDGFVNAIMQDMMGIVYISTPGYSGETTELIYQVKKVPADVNQQFTMEDCWDRFATALTESILTLQTAPIPTTSPGGSGVSTLISVS